MVEYLEIGKIINTHGIKGELKVLPLTDDHKRFDILKSVYIDIDGKLTDYKVEYVRYHKSFVLIKLRGIDDINTAESYKNKVFKIHRKNAVKLPEDTWFICDIIGMEVFNEEGLCYGKIKDVIKTGSNDVYVVHNDTKEILIPALKDVILTVNIEDKKMTVKLPKGLLDDED